MARNPYETPPSSAQGSVEPFVRNRWIAALLVLAAPALAMLYVARPLRAAVYFAAAILLLPVALFLGSKDIANPGVVSTAGSVLLMVIGAVDAYRLARSFSRPALPWYSRAPALVGFFAVAALGLLSFRAFVAEPFRMPASSMAPTLRVGDYILVDKRSYGWTIPFTGRRILRFAAPERWDVAVFRYPPDPSLDYVKRVVGVPGDTIVYASKRLSINGVEVPRSEESREGGFVRYRERIGAVTHSILIDHEAPASLAPAMGDFRGRDSCRFERAAITCTVPPGHYFVMGDNRDNSSDSRYWGFVPEDHFVGRVFLVWYSERQAERAGMPVK